MSTTVPNVMYVGVDQSIHFNKGITMLSLRCLEEQQQIKVISSQEFDLCCLSYYASLATDSHSWVCIGVCTYVTIDFTSPELNRVFNIPWQ
jgi:hypothetical protein